MIGSLKYADYLKLGVEEWRKSYKEHKKLNKKESQINVLYQNGFFRKLKRFYDRNHFELHTIPDHQEGHDPFVLFNQFNDTV